MCRNINNPTFLHVLCTNMLQYPNFIIIQYQWEEENWPIYRHQSCSQSLIWSCLGSNYSLVVIEGRTTELILCKVLFFKVYLLVVISYLVTYSVIKFAIRSLQKKKKSVSKKKNVCHLDLRLVTSTYVCYFYLCFVI